MKCIKLYATGEEHSDSDDPYYSIPSWFGNVQDALEVENIEKESSRNGDYAIPNWHGDVENPRGHSPPPEFQDSESVVDSEKSEEPVRFRPRLTSPEYREAVVNSEDLESGAPENNRDCLEITVNFILDYWKIIVLGIVGLVILLIVIFIIVFFVWIKPGGSIVATSSTTVTINGSTVTPTTVSTSRSTVTGGSTVTQALTTRVTTPIPIPSNTPSNKICTNGFDLINNKCYRLFNTPDTQFNADSECVKYSGAVLATVKNVQENKDLQNYVYHQHVDQIWLGLQCPGNEKYWCQWDHGQGDVEGYSNFAEGYPNWMYGNCTYFNSNGSWVSEDCDTVQLPYVCELPTTMEDTCDHNYNNYCYLRQDYYKTFQQGIDICKENCATMVSIHSELENLFIKSIYPDVNGYFILWLGGMAPDKGYTIWADRTPDTYHSNYSSFSYYWGCLNMNYRTGEWYTQSCKLNRWFICKRRTGVWC